MTLSTLLLVLLAMERLLYALQNVDFFDPLYSIKLLLLLMTVTCCN